MITVTEEEAAGPSNIQTVTSCRGQTPFYTANRVTSVVVLRDLRYAFTPFNAFLVVSEPEGRIEAVGDGVHAGADVDAGRAERL